MARGERENRLTQAIDALVDCEEHLMEAHDPNARRTHKRGSLLIARMYAQRAMRLCDKLLDETKRI